MTGLYDMHCHLIPGVDDGSQSIEESLDALVKEYEEGVRTIICTPHFAADSDVSYCERVKTAYDGLCARLKEQPRGSEMKLYLGNELMYSESIVERLEAGHAQTMAGSHYVLVEFLPSARYEDLYKGLRRLCNAGYAPILAHMERYRCLYKEEGRLNELKDLGIYLQVNGSSLFGGPFDANSVNVKKLVKAGRIHFLGTDSHGTHYRKPQMEKAARWVGDHCPVQLAEQILRGNPLAVLEDKIL